MTVVQNAAGTSADLFLSLSYNPASQIASRTLDNSNYAWTGHYGVNRTYATNGRNQYTQVDSTTAAGPSSASSGYDLNGNLISDGAGNSYVYDVENRLVAASGAHNAALVYDPLDRLSQLIAAGIATTFLYDGDALVAEYEGETLRRRYAHWAGSDVPLLWFTNSDFNSPEYLHADQQGSIVMLSGAGTPTINRYDEYGIPRSTNTGRFQYTGQAFLPELGLYYYKARIYSPTLGRFLQTDPVGYADHFNLYAYVGNDPVNRADPTGQCSTTGLDGEAVADRSEIGLCGNTAEERAFITARLADPHSTISNVEQIAIGAGKRVDYTEGNFSPLDPGHTVPVNGGRTESQDPGTPQQYIGVIIDPHDRVQVPGTNVDTGRQTTGIESKEDAAEHEFGGHVADALLGTGALLPNGQPDQPAREATAARTENERRARMNTSPFRREESHRGTLLNPN